MYPEEATYQIRTYKDGDEEDFARLFNNAYENYAGFVPRTSEFWTWCCKRRPGVRKEGIFIVEVNKIMVGYAVVSENGEVLEFCYDSKYAGNGIVSALLSTVENYIKSVGASSITLQVPNDDPIIRNACLKLGYAESSPSYALQLSIIDFQKLLREILHSKIEKMETLNSKVLLKVKQSSTMDFEYITLDTHHNNLIFETRMSENPDIIIEADKQTFAQCIFGNMTLLKGILTSRIKIHPFWKILKAQNLLSLLKLDSQWYIPIADYG